MATNGQQTGATNREPDMATAIQQLTGQIQAQATQIHAQTTQIQDQSTKIDTAAADQAKLYAVTVAQTAAQTAARHCDTITSRIGY